MVLGTLDDGGLFSVQLEVPNGIKPASRSTSRAPTGSYASPTCAPSRTQTTISSRESTATTRRCPRRPCRARYRTVSHSSLDESVADVAHVYATYAQDKANGTTGAPNFRDAVRQHKLIDEIVHASAAFFG